MPLGTLDRTPPPFFRQGPSALSKLVFCAALAVFLMVADTRFAIVQNARAVIATVLHPVEVALLVPVELVMGGVGYMRGLANAQAETERARRTLAAQAQRVAGVEQLTEENARLRALLQLRPLLTVRSQSSEVLFVAADPFSRKVVIDRGSTHGVMLGAPVINEAGVVGQVTRIYPLTAEVTLLTDKNASIPVLNPRTQQRSVAFGSAGGGADMELRFMAGNADVQSGDLLLTSGVDGIYPPGLSVARVMKVERRVESGFARIDLAPMVSLDGVRHVLVLEPLSTQLPPRPEMEADADKAGKAGRPAGEGRRVSRGSKGMAP